MIGLYVEVFDSPNKYEKGVCGIIIDETKNTFKIKSGNDVKIIQKKYRVFIFDYDKHKIKIKGDILYGRPEDRIKKNVGKILR